MSAMTTVYNSSKRTRTLNPNDTDRIDHIHENADLIVTIIGDGTKTKLQILDARTMNTIVIESEAQIKDSLVVGSANINNVGFEVAMSNLEQLLGYLTTANIGNTKKNIKDFQSKGVIVGIAGLVSNSNRLSDILELLTRYGFEPAMIYIGGDVELGKQLLSENGAILIASTGSICLGKVANVDRRVGGFGYALGDEGGGFYTGKLALQHALNAHYAGNTTSFTKQICEKLPVQSIEQVIKSFYSDKTVSVADIAGLASIVFDAAFIDNDPDASKIVVKVANDLAEHINKACIGANVERFPVYLIGELFCGAHCTNFIDMIAKSVQSPNVELINVANSNIVASLLRSKEPRTSALAKLCI